MRLWSIHPRYLDPKGLVALWREGLLAKAVLEGKTKGYKHHPQLERFGTVDTINYYLAVVLQEGLCRGYKFDKTKLPVYKSSYAYVATISKGQLKFETQHLKKKLIQRQAQGRIKIRPQTICKSHPMFLFVDRMDLQKASWERG